jgi:hypothetical protein
LLDLKTQWTCGGTQEKWEMKQVKCNQNATKNATKKRLISA